MIKDYMDAAKEGDVKAPQEQRLRQMNLSLLEVCHLDLSGYIPLKAPHTHFDYQP